MSLFFPHFVTMRWPLHVFPQLLCTYKFFFSHLDSEGPRFVRRSMSPGVLSVLVPVYQFNPYPNRGEYEHLSIVVHLESERIKVM